MIEFVVVQCQWQGNLDRGECYTSRDIISSHPSLHQAKRAGLRHFDHDDFNIALVEDRHLTRKLLQWTWMGEDIGEDPETLAEIAESLGWTT